ncbi:glutathione S-transferase family protein [Dinoroseobacter sp. S124A]|uniref:glutathione S-transferase family protein n=1 Tax=Dinoroseobacter sp. S124A TaxID=3415128 RepID=UPI003C7D6921
MSDYTVYGSPRSRAFRVIWMLEELGVPYTLNPVAPQSPEIRAISPTGKLPAMTVGETAITDSSAILTFLADAHGAMTAPAGSVERARQDAWLYRILDELDAVVWAAARHSFVLPEGERVPEVKPSLKREFARNLKRIAAEIGDRPFLMGDEMTVPDFVLTHCMGWSLMAKFDPLPAPLDAYHTRMRARPAYQRTSQAA